MRDAHRGVPHPYPLRRRPVGIRIISAIVATLYPIDLFRHRIWVV